MSSITYKISIGLIALTIGFYLQLFGFNSPVKHLQSPAPEIEGFFWPNQKSLVEFELVDQDNKPYTLSNLTENWSLLFFGYTHCPDICPLTMNTLRQVRSVLENGSTGIPTEGNVEVNYVFVSVDGERDTPEHLKSYLAFFGNGYTGATGSHTQIESLTSQLGVPWSIDEHEPGTTDYLVSHSGALFLISPQGKLATIFQMPHNVEQVVDRIVKIHRFTEKHS